ncbi:hypothetical protein RJ639_024604 [Escallonia herrerae]|uniref:Bet v I/Major latex protein domain-containing protein n=1 Tax=Escallonia herrerae TaxID=1293975 RepID=A0AA88V1B1_9ASTE|nr:hypothetical protein RJ639_024604 [Escallonia herrerae]
MFGTISEEIEVNVPASKAWEVYGTLKLTKVVAEGLPDALDKIEVLQGDGNAGTVLKLTFPPGNPVFTSYKEKFTIVDHVKKMKEAEVIEGAYLDLGFNLYRIRLEIIEKSAHSCITRATIEYDVKEEAAANASFVSIEPLLNIMKIAANHLLKINNSQISEFVNFTAG